MELHKCVLVLSLVVGWGVGVVPFARAVTITVDTTTDELNADNDCSLREAVRAANLNTAVDACPAGSDTAADEILVPAGAFTLTMAGPATEDDAADGDLDVTGDLVITGSGAALTIIQACTVDQRTAPCPAGQGIVSPVFALPLATPTITVEIAGVTIRNGRFEGFASSGGGIAVAGNPFMSSGHTLILSDSNVRNCMAERGGGISSVGTLELVDCRVEDNIASAFQGGGISHSAAASSGTLALTRSTVSNNRSSAGGGGIRVDGPAALTDSTVSNNTSSIFSTAGDGGGISKSGRDALVLLRSTVSGNSIHTSGAGGGILASRVALTNSTISGNTAADGCGGGMYVTGFPNSLHNVTITDNTILSGDGGGFCGTGVQTTITNTIIAGNHDASPAGNYPDCVGVALATSGGFNLIGIGTGLCAFANGVNGDRVGTAESPLDPELGVLLDNGGWTETHALLAGSPAADAANPAAPGSGGFACDTTDQRGVPRPADADQNGTAVCDIGAFEAGELLSGFFLSDIRPAHGGNTGSVTALLYGGGFIEGATVRLARGGQTVEGSAVAAGSDGSVIAAAFDLRGRTPGPWDVVVTNPDATSETLPAAFAVQEGGAPQLWIDIIGPREMRVGQPARLFVLYGNNGNVDAFGVPFGISFPADYPVTPRFPIAPPPTQPGQVPTDWSAVPLTATLDEQGARAALPLFLPVVPAGFSGALEFALTAARLGPFQVGFGVGAASSQPELDPLLLDRFREQAVAYAERVFGTSVLPPDAIMAQYVADQIQQAVSLGADALATSQGRAAQVHSGSHLVIDVAQFAGAYEPPARAAGLAALLPPLALPFLTLGQAHAQPSLPAPRCLSPGGVVTGGILFCDFVLDADLTGRTSVDPNDKIGGRPFFTSEEPLRYAIFFENDPALASAPAQVVVVTDQLDTSVLDLSTFSLGPISFGDEQVVPPPGLSEFSTTVDLRPTQDLLVGVDVRLDTTTGLLTWRFGTLDLDGNPLDPADVAGFLPPNVNPPEGDGSLVFTVQPKLGLPSGTTVCNDASIVFDANAPIVTPEWCNTLDEVKPVSQVDAVDAAECSTELLVRWSGSDVGAGIEDYSIFFSEDGGPFLPWLTDTSATSATFVGEVGRTYAFHSVARDHAGNAEDAPAAPDAVAAVADCGSHDLAVVHITAPKKVTLTGKRPVQTKIVKVLIQNRSPHTEVIGDLNGLVSLAVASLGTCDAPTTTLVSGPPQKKLPFSLKSKKKLNVAFAVTFACANTPAAGTGDEDYTVSAEVHHAALGVGDAHPQDDVCPRQVDPPGEVDPFPDGKILDKGCGGKKADRTFGAPILVDVVVKR